MRGLTSTPAAGLRPLPGRMVQAMPTADLIVANARVLTMDAARPTAQAVAVRDGRILGAGSEAEIAALRGPDTRVLDAAGHTVTPGIHDAHFHVSMGAQGIEDAQLGDVTEPGQLADALRAHAAATPGEWVIGRRLTYGLRIDGRRLDRTYLDAILPDRPLAIFSIDFHTVWANTEALRRSGLLHGAEIPGGAVLMGEGGLATGELHERPAFERLLRSRPAPSRADTLRRLRKALAEAASFGITSVTDMLGSPADQALYQELEHAGELTMRIAMPFHMAPHEPIEAIRDAALPMRARDTEWVRTYGIKVFLDGVIDSGTAQLLRPYADAPTSRGMTLFDPEPFERIVAEADRHGLQVAVHAIGDAAVRRTLDAYEAAARVHGARDARHRVEHIELIDPADVPRFRELGVVASMQPLHASRPELGRYTGWLDKVGAQRWPHAFPWRTLRDAGARVAFGTDWPVVPMDPFASLEAALGRAPWGDGHPDQRMGLHDALAAFTREAAWAEHAEDRKGRIAPGQYADLVVLDADIGDLSPDELADVRPTFTLVGGRIVHRAERA